MICGVPLGQLLFQISDLSNPLWTRIHRITDLSDLQTDHQINDPGAFLWVKDPKLITVRSDFGLELCTSYMRSTSTFGVQCGKWSFKIKI